MSDAGEAHTLSHPAHGEGLRTNAWNLVRELLGVAWHRTFGKQSNEVLQLLEKGSDRTFRPTPRSTVQFCGRGLIKVVNSGRPSNLQVEAFEITTRSVFEDAMIGYRVYLGDDGRHCLPSGAWESRTHTRTVKGALTPGERHLPKGGVFYFTFRGDRSLSHNLSELVGYVDHSRARVAQLRNARQQGTHDLSVSH